MSQENVDWARRNYAILNEAFRSGDFRALERHNAETVDPKFVLRPGGTFDEPDEMYGHDGALRFARALMEPFDAVCVEPQDFIQVSGRLLVPIRFRGRARHTGIELALDRFHVWTYRGGKVVQLDVYAKRSQALEAVGLSE